jgi:hypothetical protein
MSLTEQERRPHTPPSRRVQTAPQGHGPLLQRDYIGVIEGTESKPEHLMEMVLADFPHFSPPALAPFSRCGDTSVPLRAGDEMEVDIRGTGWHRVRVALVQPRTLTLRTIAGHPEAGRVSFGADYDELGRLVFRIRSRARISSRPAYIGYLLFGRVEQTQIWVAFIHSVARAVGGRVRDEVACFTRRAEGSLADMGLLEAPTFPSPEVA